MRPRRALALVASLVLAACGGSASGSPSPTSAPGPSGCSVLATATPTSPPKGGCGGQLLDPGELRLVVMDRLGERWFCDPDEYPVALGTERERALERWDEMAAEGVVFRAVAARLGINAAGAVTDDQKQAIYHLWKAAISIPMDPVASDRYRFDYVAMPIAGNELGTRTAGLIDTTGAMTIEQRVPAQQPPCPICLARGQTIDTPNGPIAVEALRIGDAVWTMDANGRRTAGTVIALGSTIAPPSHRVVQLTLEDGRIVTASPGHPLADGRQLGTLAVGDVVDGSAIASLESLPYGDGETFDLVASGATGGYYANGISLGTTLLPWSPGGAWTAAVP